jgi:hypothetical protein
MFAAQQLRGPAST